MVSICHVQRRSPGKSRSLGKGHRGRAAFPGLEVLLGNATVEDWLALTAHVLETMCPGTCILTAELEAGLKQLASLGCGVCGGRSDVDL